MRDFKAIVLAEGQLPPHCCRSFDTVKLTFDGQCCVMFRHNVLADKFFQHCLGLYVIFTTVFNTFFSTGRTAEIAETTAL
jgi:hypothetical protein